MSTERYRENSHAPSVRFIRKGGRVIPIVTGSKTGVKSRVAGQIVNDQLHGMEHSVDIAEKGKRVHLGYGTDHEVRGMSSTFPKFYSEIGFKNKADFKTSLDKPGAKQERLIQRAIEDIKKGETYGFGGPNVSTNFKLATRQIFDNQNVIFRKMSGKVVPIRTAKVRNQGVHVEEPFL